MLDRRVRERCIIGGSIALGMLVGLGPASESSADGWAERIELHGFFDSTARFISPQLDLAGATQLGAWQQRFNLEATMDLYEKDDWTISGGMVLQPSYDVVYDLYPTVYGKRAQSGAFGTQLAQAGFARNPSGFLHGDAVAGAGDGIDGAFRYINQDIAFLFTGKNNPGIVIDDVVFYGQTVAPAGPRGSNQVKLGGAPTLSGLFQGPARAQTSLLGSFGMASQPAGTPLRSPLQIANGARALGDRGSLDHSSFGINRTEGQLRTNCFDNANPWCFLRELYVDVEKGDTFVRLGKQQIVWGKTDAFRMQDIINPLEISDANIFTPLEERRIPQWSVDVVHSFGDVGPLQDLSLELVWVVDRFLPTQLGQCGEPRAFLATCAARTNAAAHGLFGLALAEFEERDWQIRNTEPGFRLEGRFADPAISWSFSGFWGFQDTPVTKLKNGYSFTNPNPGAILFLQGLGVASQFDTGGPLAALGAFAPTFIGGFDPYSVTSINTVATELRTLHLALFGPGGALCNAATATSVQAHADCISASQLQLLSLPFSGGQLVLEHPRTLTLGGSLDYQIPGADAIVNLEMAFDFDRAIISSAEVDLVDNSNVVSAAIGLDWSPFIPWINRSRTSLVAAQLFVEHILDYEDQGQGRRMIPDETQVISTFLMQNYWRNDSLILTNFVAWDWNAQAIAWGPSLKWILNESVFVEMGAQLVWSKPQKTTFRNTCGGDLTIACISDPANFQSGNFQSINQGFARTAEGPLYSASSFGDHLEEDRDTIFFKVTYQF